MLVYTSSFFLLSGSLLGLFILQINAAPASYDQRQTGEFNVDTRLENFLVLVATSGSSNLFSNLMTQALELNELIKERSKTRGKPSETVVYETEDVDGGREPYHVDIVHIEKEGDSKHPDIPPNAKGEEEIESGTPLKLVGNGEKNSEQTPDSTDSKRVEKKIRSIWKSAIGRGLIHDSIGELKSPIDMKNLQVKNLDHPDDLSVKEEALKATRPGISLKKQLSKKEEEDISSLPQERNELSNRHHELVLVGGGIENCGPGRYRDKLGVCQNDEDFD